MSRFVCKVLYLLILLLYLAVSALTVVMHPCRYSVRAAAANALADDVALWVFAATEQLNLNSADNQNRLSAAQQHLAKQAQQGTQHGAGPNQHLRSTAQQHMTHEASSSSSGELIDAQEEAACKAAREAVSALDALDAPTAAEGLKNKRRDLQDDPSTMQPASHATVAPIAVAFHSGDATAGLQSGCAAAAAGEQHAGLSPNTGSAQQQHAQFAEVMDYDECSPKDEVASCAKFISAYSPAELASLPVPCSGQTTAGHDVLTASYEPQPDRVTAHLESQVGAADVRSQHGSHDLNAANHQQLAAARWHSMVSAAKLKVKEVSSELQTLLQVYNTSTLFMRPNSGNARVAPHDVFMFNGALSLVLVYACAIFSKQRLADTYVCCPCMREVLTLGVLLAGPVTYSVANRNEPPS